MHSTGTSVKASDRRSVSVANANATIPFPMPADPGERTEIWPRLPALIRKCASHARLQRFEMIK